MSFRNSPPRGPAEPPAHRTPRLTVPREQLAGELEARVAEGQQLRQQLGGNSDTLRQRQDAYTSWHDYNQTLLRQRFDSDEPATKYAATGVAYLPAGLQDQWEFLGDRLNTRIQRLSSLKDQLALFDIVMDLDSRPASGPAAVVNVDGVQAVRDVFIVHGHDGHTKVVVARFLAQLTGSEPVILHEQPDGGSTLIEKLERNAARAGAAVVLLTADDLGGTRGGAGKDGDDPGPQRARARQNVVFEHGYFLARLGRERVVMLYEPSVELPSDLSGVVYTPLDAGGAWKNLLARELQHMGYEVDLNALLRG